MQHVRVLPQYQARLGQEGHAGRATLVLWGLGASLSCDSALSYQVWRHCSGRMYTNNICAYIKEIFTNIKSNSARATSFPGEKYKVSAQVSCVLLCLQSCSMPTRPVRPQSPPPQPYFKPLYLGFMRHLVSDHNQQFPTKPVSQSEQRGRKSIALGDLNSPELHIE